MMQSTTADQLAGIGSSLPKRKAAYVTIATLVNSQYNIDLQKLKDELRTLKSHDADVTAEAAAPQAASESAVGSSEETKENKEPSMRSSSCSHSSLSLAKYHHQSRLQPPRDGFNLCVRVGKVELVVDKSRVDGSRVLVAEVEVGDESGSVSLRARDEQIDLLQRVSSDAGAIVLRNCTMELYQGKHLRLAVSKWGKMSVYPDGIDSTPSPPTRIDQEINFSLVDLNLIATSKSPSPMPTHVSRPQQRPHRHQGESTRRGSPRHQYYRGRGGRHQLQHNPQRRPRSVSNASSGQQQLFHQPPGSPQHFVHYQQYAGDEGSVYSYHSQQQEQTLSPQHQHGQPYNYPYNQHSRQQDLMYEQYRLQQQHEHQLHMLQRQQESQRRMLQHQQFQDQHHQMAEPGVMPSLMPDLSLDMAEFSVPSTPTLHYSQLSSPGLQPSPSHPPPEQYGLQLPPPQMGNLHQEAQQLSSPSYASIISPTSSPRHFGHPGPQPHQHREDKRNP
mmetsp:Transcript_8636/g.13017  ORF Transcript_8636/g.13017 Transcript_8636/m.13017 type:complete len:501 (+) Transcript_8636:92-1594(+)